MRFKYTCALSMLLSCSMAFALPHNGNVFRAISPTTRSQTTLPKEIPASNIQLMSIEDAITVNDAMSGFYSQELKEATNISQSPNSQLHIGSRIINMVTIVGGALLIPTGAASDKGAALIVGGALSMIMMSSAGMQITSAIASQLVAQGASAQDAQILANVLIAAGVIVLSVGAGGMISAEDGPQYQLYSE